MLKKLLALTCLLMITTNAHAVEEAKYQLLLQQDDIEIRLYEPAVVAEVIVDGDIESAGNEAFRPLFNYISGDNSRQADIAMTAPVSQQATGEQIAMTAPVSQQQAGDRWIVNFMMPAIYTLETLPTPNNNQVSLRQLPEQLMAVIRYSGFWSESNYLDHKLELEAWLSNSDYQIDGEPVWARYNAPFMPWFLRRNEVLIPITKR